MLRNEWKFEYTARVLADAAQKRLGFHRERLAFWKQKREDVLGQIRAEGVEVDEKIVLGYRNPKSRDWEQAGKIMIRNDLQKDLEEVYDKLNWHTEKLANYTAWQQVLAANPDNRVALDVDDWQFFFAEQ